jgi:hypothetical protein
MPGSRAAPSFSSCGSFLSPKGLNCTNSSQEWRIALDLTLERLIQQRWVFTALNVNIFSYLIVYISQKTATGFNDCVADWLCESFSNELFRLLLRGDRVSEPRTQLHVPVSASSEDAPQRLLRARRNQVLSGGDNR